MKISTLTFLLIIMCFSGCEEKKPIKNDVESVIDELKKSQMVDSMVQASILDAMFDTIGLSEAPVKVISARFIKKEYSNYKDISLTYKNISDKRISAIKFKWYALDAFGEPADVGAGVSQGFGGGFDDDEMGKGLTRTSSWSIYSSRAKKVVLAWPYEVAFTDGTIWKL